MGRRVLIAAGAVAWSWFGCAPGDDSAVDARLDRGVDASGADADVEPGEDVALPDGSDEDAAGEIEAGGDDGAADDATAAEDVAPAEPVCRYECATDGDCSSVYGAGWVCRDMTFTAPRLCLTLCSADADCRAGVGSDPLMVCRSGACAMRACASDAECGWVGSRPACRSADWGTFRSCQRPCSTDADCAMGSPSDVLYHCEAGLCAWYCDTDEDCRTAFGSSAYGCRVPEGVAGPTCVRDCDTATDCMLGGPSDVMAVCR